MERINLTETLSNITANITDGGLNTAADVRGLLIDLADSKLERVPVHYWQSNVATPNFPGLNSVSTINVLPRRGMYHVEIPAWTGTGTRYIHFMTETSSLESRIIYNYIDNFEISIGHGGILSPTSNGTFDDRFDIQSNPQRAYYHSTGLTRNNVAQVVFSTRRFSIPEE